MAAWLLSVVVLIAGIGGAVWWFAAGEAAVIAPVDRYLSAVAAGNSAKALQELASPPADATLLTDGVLRLSRGSFRVVSREVTPQGVAVEAVVRGVPVTWVFPVEYRDGQWKVRGGVAKVVVPGSGDLLVNGVRSLTHTLTLFPGEYTIVSDSGYLTHGQVIITSVGEPIEVRSAVLTDAGRPAIVEAWKSLVQRCTVQGSLQPAACPFAAQVAPGWTVQPDTIRWVLTNDPWSTPVLPSAVHGVYEAKVILAMTVTATYVKDGREITRTDPAQVTVTMSADATTKPPTVTWRN